MTFLLQATMKKSDYDSMPTVIFGNWECRIVRKKNKTIALLDGQYPSTPFTNACKMLDHLSTLGAENTNTSPKTISVDVMRIGYDKGTIADLIGSINASRYHDVVVYEDRGVDLTFLKRRITPNYPTTPENTWEASRRQETQSEAIRLQEKIAIEQQSKNPSKDKGEEKKKGLNKILTLLKPKQKYKKTNKTRADMGQTSAPELPPASGAKQHMKNAFLEYTATVRETIKINLAICEKIRRTFELENEGLLKVLLKEEKAAIYNNISSEYIRGKTPKEPHQAAYSVKNGFVKKFEINKEETGPLKYITPIEDPILVVARCTEVSLEDKILQMAESIEDPTRPWEDWTAPKFHWVNSVPGCGKSTWVVKNFDSDRDLIATTTTEAAQELRNKIAFSCQKDAKTKVRTIASVLINGVRKIPERFIVDEALMNHFGAIIMAARITEAKTVTLIGDINQIPYIDRLNLFKMKYISPCLVTSISQELLRTYRSLLDVTYALNEVYNGIYSAQPITRSLRKSGFTGATIIANSPNTLYLVHTQEEKDDLIHLRYGKGENSRILTINEAQGLTYASVVIIQTKSKKNSVHDSVPHAIVALSRHTKGCMYYTDIEEDAITRFIRRANESSMTNIWDYNLKMAIFHRDSEAMKNLIQIYTKHSEVLIT